MVWINYVSSSFDIFTMVYVVYGGNPRESLRNVGRGKRSMLLFMQIGRMWASELWKINSESGSTSLVFSFCGSWRLELRLPYSVVLLRWVARELPETRGALDGDLRSFSYDYTVLGTAMSFCLVIIDFNGGCIIGGLVSTWSNFLLGAFSFCYFCSCTCG